MMNEQTKITVGWRVGLPVRQDGPMLHPAETEILRADDGWTVESARTFAHANGGQVVSRIVREAA